MTFGWIGRQRFLFSTGNSLVSSVIIAWLGADRLQAKLIEYWTLCVPIWVLLPTFLLFIWLVGWAWVRFGGYAAEAGLGWGYVPQIQTLLGNKNVKGCENNGKEGVR